MSQSAEKDGATSTEWGVVIDDLGSCDMADSEQEARAWLASGDGLALVRVVVTEWTPEQVTPARKDWRVR